MTRLSKPPPGRRRQLVQASLTLLALTLFGWAVWRQQAPARAIQALSSEQRAQLYARTIQELTDICEQPVEDGLVPHCEEQRAFVELFPECRTACRDLLMRQTARFRPR